jgi:hypothetical protein
MRGWIVYESVGKVVSLQITEFSRHDTLGFMSLSMK